MHVGIAGTGKMGSAMARRLLAQGRQVSVWNRTAAAAAACVAAGARQVATAKELAQACDIVISVVLDAVALDAVYGGPQGLLAGAAPGKTFIEMSTVRPAVQEANAAKVAATGAGYVECPVGGSTGPALEGKLMGFAGGSDADVAAARPVLELLCRRLEHLGPVGAGSAMKLAINLPLMVYWQAFGEAMGLIAHLDVDPKRVVDIFSETSGGPNMLKVRGGMIAQALAHTPSGAVTVNVATIRKDLRTMIDETASLQRVAPLAAQALACFDRAAAAGVDTLDCTELPAWWVREGGVRQ
jgi:3-hydroxyisobutyrate dehydrogenase